MNKILVVFICLITLSCNHPESKEFERSSRSLTGEVNNFSYSDSELGYKVICVKDGDTFEILMNGKVQVIRFAHIDCPEKKQPFGQKAKQFVSDLCYGKNVTLIHNSRFDRNKRLIAEVILQDGTNLNKELVRNGLAWHFKKYSKDNSYADLENEARESKVGLWADNNPIPPWTWRK